MSGSVASAVNHIIKKLRRVKFFSVSNREIEIEFGFHRYFVRWVAFDERSVEYQANRVERYIMGLPVYCEKDTYSDWVTGVLNGMTRNEDGSFADRASKSYCQSDPLGDWISNTCRTSFVSSYSEGDRGSE